MTERKYIYPWTNIGDIFLNSTYKQLLFLCIASLCPYCLRPYWFFFQKCDTRINFHKSLVVYAKFISLSFHKVSTRLNFLLFLTSHILSKNNTDFDPLPNKGPGEPVSVQKRRTHQSLRCMHANRATTDQSILLLTENYSNFFSFIIFVAGRRANGRAGRHILSVCHKPTLPDLFRQRNPQVKTAQIGHFK